MYQWIMNIPFTPLLYILFAIAFIFGVITKIIDIKDGDLIERKRISIIGEVISGILFSIFFISAISLIISGTFPETSSETNCPIADYVEYPVLQIIQESDRFIILYENNNKKVITKDSILSDNSILRISGADTGNKNVVRDEIVEYNINWVWKVKKTKKKTNVYLSEDIYNTIYSYFYNVIYP